MTIVPPPERYTIHVETSPGSEDAEAIIEEARRRARRRRLRNAWGVATILAVGIGVAFAAGRGGDERNPAHALPDSPRPVVTPVKPLHVRNGKISVFGFLRGIVEVGKQGRPHRFIVRCDPHCSQVSGADWSADGTILVYSTACAGACVTEGDPHHGIHVRNVATGDDRIIVHTDAWGSLSVTADGSRVAYSNEYKLYVVPTDGTQPPTMILDSTRESNAPLGQVSWSPDGSQIAYSVVGKVYTISADGTKTSMLTPGHAAAWSANGREIAYLWKHQLRIVNPTTRRTHLLVDLTPVCPCGGSIDSLVWSPDGKKMAFVSNERITIVTLRTATTQLLSRQQGLSDSAITWQPIPIT